MILGNDYYGIIQFNLIFHVCYYRIKFKNLERLEFEGQIDENSLITLLLDLHEYRNLKTIKLVNKGTFFNTKLLLENGKVLDTGIFSQNYSIKKTKGD